MKSHSCPAVFGAWLTGLCWFLQQIQFHAKGPSNSAVVQCSMYQDSGKQWQYDLLFLDFGGPVRQRVFLEGQQHQ
jgi:hypothetical protein